MRRSVALLCGVVVAAALLTGCGGDGDDDATGSTAVVPDPTTTAPPEDGGDDSDDPGGDATTTTTTVGSVDDLSDAAITLTLVAEVDSPTVLAVRPGSEDLYVGERGGAVRPIRFAPADGGQRAEVGAPILDVSTTTDGERGLLGLAFSPDGERLLVSYTDPNGDTRVDSYDASGDTVDPGTRQELFSTDQPYANHNGGQIAYGPDGRLYLGLGDGGGGGDPLRTAQDPNHVLGSIVRFDENESNPEVWVMGVRNPWRYAWDRATDDLWVSDVGQNAVEEVTVLPAEGDDPPGRGANLGWPIFEGNEPYEGGDPPPGYVPPAHTYTHDPGCSITGGYVSRGEALAALRGAYLYSDYCDPTLRAVLVRDGEVVDGRSLDVEVPGGAVVSFGEGPEGELYVLSLAGGIYRIDPA